jgi:hypothetical protein
MSAGERRGGLLSSEAGCGVSAYETRAALKDRDTRIALRGIRKKPARRAEFGFQARRNPHEVVMGRNSSQVLGRMARLRVADLLQAFAALEDE